MNDAHLHLLLNHLPAVGLVFAFGVLVVGAFLRSATTMRVGLWLIVISGLLILPAYLTGEPAEKVAKKFGGFSRDLMHTHEHAAIYALWSAIAAAATAAGALFLARAGEVPRFALVAVIAVTLGSLGSLLWTAKLGGEIRHPETALAPRR